MSRILAADIGGTNCRLALFESVDGELVLKRKEWIKTSDIPHTEALLASFEKSLSLHPHQADVVVTAIAGPVQDSESGKLSNGSLLVNFAPLNAGAKRFFLINDFMAQAYAVLSPEGGKARLIAGPEDAVGDGTRAIIGAGTGLGQATLIRLQTGPQSATWLAIPSENGHTPFTFVSEEEQAYHSFLRRRLNRPFVTGDIALTGQGLPYLHEYLTGERLEAKEVGMQALSRDTETLAWYARFYARVCRNWIMCTLCDGGLWIAGGIAAQNPLVLECDYFRDELYNLPGWEHYLRTIPIRIMDNMDSGLWGAARFGQQKLETSAS